MKRFSFSLAIGSRVQQGSRLNQIPITNLVQRLFKASQPVSQSLGTKAIDYSPVPINANIWQSCLIGVASDIFSLNENIVVDWSVDGLKLEFISSQRAGVTGNFVAITTQGDGSGVLTRNTGMTINYKKIDNSYAVLTFSTIQTPSDNLFYRYKISKSGNNVIVQKTTPDDINYVTATTETKDVSVASMSSDSYKGFRIQGSLCFMNLSGYKFAFAEGNEATISFSYNSNKRVSAIYANQFSGSQNVYCHNAVYGYTSAFVDFASVHQNIMLAYQEDGTPSHSFHDSYFTHSLYEEFPASKSFGRGYSIKLDASIEAYDQGNTFFDISHAANAIYKNLVPTKLNSRLFFDHKNNMELLIYSADKTISRPINLVNKKVIAIGDSIAGTSYFWTTCLKNLFNFILTTNSYPTYTLSLTPGILSLLQSAVSSNPTLVSSQDVIIMEGGFNDYIQNVDEATFTAGIVALYNYIRSQNATAWIFVCLPYDTGLPIVSGDVPNSGGLTKNRIRELMAALVAANPTKSVYVDWSLAGIVQADLDGSGLHPATIVCGQKIAKLMYDKMLTIYD